MAAGGLVCPSVPELSTDVQKAGGPSEHGAAPGHGPRFSVSASFPGRGWGCPGRSWGEGGGGAWTGLSLAVGHGRQGLGTPHYELDPHATLARVALVHPIMVIDVPRATSV